jgi:hypothetical protein
LFRTIRPKRIAELTLPPRRPAPTFCKEEGQIDGSGIDTILDNYDKDQNFASGMVVTWLAVASYAALMSAPALH